MLWWWQLRQSSGFQAFGYVVAATESDSRVLRWDGQSRAGATSPAERPFHSSRTASNHIPVAFSLARKQSHLWVKPSRGTQKPTDNRSYECTAIHQSSGSKLPNSLLCGLKGDLLSMGRSGAGERAAPDAEGVFTAGAGSVAPPGQPHRRRHGHGERLRVC